MPDRRPSRRARNAFTLVELLVVVGIIAVLIGLLLPAVIRARQSAYSVKCMSNLRGIEQAMFSYAAENRGSLPWGFACNTVHANGSLANGGIFHWSSLLNKYMGTGRTGLLTQPPFDNQRAEVWSDVFRCPEVAQDTFPQAVDYAGHSVAMPNLNTELSGSDDWGQLLDGFGEIFAWDSTLGNPVARPAKLNQLWPDNALFWDTNVTPFFLAPMDPNYGNLYSFGQAVSLIDWGQLTNPNYPETRFRGAVNHWQAGSPFQQEDSIFIGATTGGWLINQDAGANSIDQNQVGDARFRHLGNTTCNVAFADGSIRGLKMGKTHVAESGGFTFPDTEFRRRYIMLKWPPGYRPTGGLPGWIP